MHDTTAANSPSVTLVGHPAFRPFRNVWLLEELGLPYTRVDAKPASKGAKDVNPFGKIPTLIDGDFKMYESAAINTYLCDKYARACGAPTLIPAPGSILRGRYEQVVFCIMAELDAQGLWIHRKHDAHGAVFGAIPEAVEAARKHFLRTLKILLTELQAQGDFLVGPDFTAADILFVHCLEWAKSITWLPSPDLSEDRQATLAAYLERCRARPAYQRAAALRKTAAAAKL